MLNDLNGKKWTTFDIIMIQSRHKTEVFKSTILLLVLPLEKAQKNEENRGPSQYASIYNSHVVVKGGN